MILFPYFPCDAENTLNEFAITEISVENEFSVLAMNLNQRLYLNQKEKQELAKRLTRIVQEQKLSEKNIFVGGFSSGGNVSLLICDYLKRNKSQILRKYNFVFELK